MPDDMLTSLRSDDRTQVGVPPLRRSVALNDWIKVPPCPSDDVEFAFKFRAGPKGVPVVTAYAVKETKPTTSAHGIKGRVQGYRWAREKAIKILVRQGEWWEPTDMDAIGSLLDGLPDGSDISEDMIGHIASGKLPEKDNMHYALYALRYVKALRSKGTERAAIAAVRAILRAEGLHYAHSTVEADITEAKRRRLDEAAGDVLDSGAELTPTAVMRAARRSRIRAGGTNLSGAARWLLHTIGSLDPEIIEAAAKERNTTGAKLFDEARNAAKSGRAEQLAQLSDAELTAAAEHVAAAELNTNEAADRVARAEKTQTLLTRAAASYSLGAEGCSFD
jgi:hypothetical protein